MFTTEKKHYRFEIDFYKQMMKKTCVFIWLMEHAFSIRYV